MAMTAACSTSFSRRRGARCSSRGTARWSCAWAAANYLVLASASRLPAAVAILERGVFVVRGAGGALLCGDEEEDVTEDIIRDSFSHGAVAVLGRRAPAPEGASDLVLHRRFLTQLGAQSFHMAGPQGGVIARFRGGPRPR